MSLQGAGPCPMLLKLYQKYLAKNLRTYKSGQLEQYGRKNM